MAIFDGDINHIADDVVAEDGVKARAFLSKLDPQDPQDAEDGRKLMEALHKIMQDPQDPQDAADGQRFMAWLKKKLGIQTEVPTVVEPTNKIVDTSILTGSRDGLKDFLIKKSRENDSK